MTALYGFLAMSPHVPPLPLKSPLGNQSVGQIWGNEVDATQENPPLPQCRRRLLFLQRSCGGKEFVASSQNDQAKGHTMRIFQILTAAPAANSWLKAARRIQVEWMDGTQSTEGVPDCIENAQVANHLSRVRQRRVKAWRPVGRKRKGFGLVGRV